MMFLIITVAVVRSINENGGIDLNYSNRIHAIYGVLRQMREGSTEDEEGIGVEFPAYLLPIMNPRMMSLIQAVRGHAEPMELAEIERNVLNGLWLPGTAGEHQDATIRDYVHRGTGYFAVKATIERLVQRGKEKIIKLGEEITINDNGPYLVGELQHTVDGMRQELNRNHAKRNPGVTFIPLGDRKILEADSRDYEIRTVLMQALNGINDLVFVRDNDVMGFKLREEYRPQESGEDIYDKIYQVLEAVQQISNPAMKTPSAIKEGHAVLASVLKGGIDFNAANLAMVIKRDGHGVPLPLAQQDMAQLSRLQGFDAQIIEIRPAIDVPIISELEQKLQTSPSQS